MTSPAAPGPQRTPHSARPGSSPSTCAASDPTTPTSRRYSGTSATSWKKPYSDRGVRKILARYTQAAGITASISPHTLRHFLFTWLKTQGIDDAFIQPYSGHATRQSLEIHSRLALADAQQRYDDVIGNFPV